MSTPTQPRVVNRLACALGCILPSLILTSAFMVLAVQGCPGDVARWTGRTEGKVVVEPGMTKAQVQQRSTVNLGPYGDSGRFVDFVLPTEGIVFRGIQMFMFTSGKDGRVSDVSMFSANESWPDLVRAATRTEEILLANGWKPDPGQPSIRSLTRDPQDAAAGITGSGAIAGADFSYSKGKQKFRIAAGGLWSGIPSWRNPHRARVFGEIWTTLRWVIHKLKGSGREMSHGECLGTGGVFFNFPSSRTASKA